MEKAKRTCGFYWSTDDWATGNKQVGRIGSNHTCTQDHGHDGLHFCHCGVGTPPPVTRGQAIELAEQIQIALREFVEGLKEIPHACDANTRTALNNELRESARVLCDNAYVFLSRIVAHGLG